MHPPYTTILPRPTVFWTSSQAIRQWGHTSNFPSSFLGIYAHAPHLFANFWNLNPHALHSITSADQPSLQYGVILVWHEQQEQVECGVVDEMRREVDINRRLGTRWERVALIKEPLRLFMVGGRIASVSELITSISASVSESTGRDVGLLTGMALVGWLWLLNFLPEMAVLVVSTTLVL